jgi:RNA polymerase sigma-70 factor (ECF subfamily)
VDITSQLRTSASLLIAVRDPSAGQAWASFTARYEGPIRRWCRCRGLGPEAEDAVTQQVLVKLLDEMRTFVYDPRRRFRAWLHRVVSNEVAAYWRAWHRAGAVRPVPETLPDPDVVGADEALAAAEEQMDRDLLVRAACERVQGRVKEQSWMAFWYTTVDGLEGKEVAVRLGIPVGSVYVHKSRILGMIREEIEVARDGKNPARGRGHDE